MGQRGFETQRGIPEIALHHAVAPRGDPTHLVEPPILDTGNPAEAIEAQKVATGWTQLTGIPHDSRELGNGEAVLVPTPAGIEAQMHIDDGTTHAMWTPMPRRQ